MKFFAAIFLALFVSINAYPYAVIEVAKVASAVGSHGPALINLHWPNTWPGSYWGAKGQTSSGYDGSSEGWGSGGGWATAEAGSGHDGKYIAINRGSVHIAPLVGHTQSVKSQNYEPAPGTTW